MSKIEKDQTFEESFARLEQIVKALESGNLSLDDSLKAFEEGVGLVNKCNTQLSEAEQRVKILVSGPDGTLEKTDFKAT